MVLVENGQRPNGKYPNEYELDSDTNTYKLKEFKDAAPYKFNKADKSMYERFTLAKLSGECRCLGEEVYSRYIVPENTYFQETGDKSVVINDYENYDPRTNNVFNFMRSDSLTSNTSEDSSNENNGTVDGGGASNPETPVTPSTTPTTDDNDPE